MRETIRPTIYRVMKYWGKKPHNIWNSYIKKYTKKGDLVLDPFVGSGMTYFESIKAGRTPITMDINPISDLCIRCLTIREVKINDVLSVANNIINKVKETECYQKEYLCICSKCNKITEIYNYKTNGKKTISYKCNNCNETITDVLNTINQHKIYSIDKWAPSKKLSSLVSVPQAFIDKVGGDNISNIWSNRNLKLLSELYSEILNVDNEQIKDILVFAFIQSLHLTSKMCIPRGEKSNRPLSTSWGRPAYMLSKKIFEQNPVLAFEKAISNGTGVLKGMSSSEEYLGKTLPKESKHFLGNAKDVLKKISDNSINLIITDPPYGNIIQYGDLSEVWVSWLEHYKTNYKINHENEIIINSKKTQDDYKTMLMDVFNELNRVLKNDGTFILTFNSNQNDDWHSLFYALKLSGFYVEDLIFQKNRRSSEANVGAKSGIAISDYYMICKKGQWKINNSVIKNFFDERGITL